VLTNREFVCPTVYVAVAVAVATAKDWTSPGIVALLLSITVPEFVWQDGVQLPQREAEIPQTVVILPVSDGRLTFHRSEAADNSCVGVQNEDRLFVQPSQGRW
jgi:hypothetical protein